MCRSLSKALAKVFEGVSSTDGSRLFRRDRLTGGSGFLAFFGTSSWNNVRFVFFSASVEIRRDRRGASELSEPEDGTRLRFAGFTSGSDSSLKTVYIFVAEKIQIWHTTFSPSFTSLHQSTLTWLQVHSLLILCAATWPVKSALASPYLALSIEWASNCCILG